MKSINTKQDRKEAIRRISNIEYEISDLEDDIGKLQVEIDTLEEKVALFDKRGEIAPQDHPVAALLKIAREHWERFTWRETRIVERFVDGDDRQRVQIMLMREGLPINF